MANAAFIDENREGVTSTGQSWLRAASPTCADGCSYAPFVFGTGIPRVTEAITGPVWKQEDVSLLKYFNITEKIRFQLKADAYDLFNRHRMGLPDTEPGDYPTGTGSTGFGIPTYTDYGPRFMQIMGRFTF
jgi:hypothetical protein